MKISGLFFAMVILAFLLPFLVVKCADTEIVKLSGLKLAVGGEIKSPFMDKMSEEMGSMKFSGDNAEEDKTKPDEKENTNRRMKPNVFALLALVLAIGGAALAIILDKGRYIILVVVAALGFLSLLLIKSGFNSNLTGGSGPDMSGMLKVETQIGFFLALIFFIGAAVTAFIFGRPHTQTMLKENFEGFYATDTPVSPIESVPPIAMDEPELPLETSPEAPEAPQGEPVKETEEDV